jgi:hypothetical protein
LARLRRGKLDVRPPQNPDGEAAVNAPDDLRESIVNAVINAAKADPVVWAEIGPRW